MQTRLFRGRRSRNKVSVGEPAEGSFARIIIIHCESMPSHTPLPRLFVVGTPLCVSHISTKEKWKLHLSASGVCATRAVGAGGNTRMCACLWISLAHWYWYLFQPYLFYLSFFFSPILFGVEKQTHLENFSDECLGSGNDEGRSELR